MGPKNSHGGPGYVAYYDELHSVLKYSCNLNEKRQIYIQIFYLRWLIKAMREKNVNLFPQHIILFPQYVILFPIQDDHQFNIGPYGKYIQRSSPQKLPGQLEPILITIVLG